MENLPIVVGEKGASIKSKHTMSRFRTINEPCTNSDIDFRHISTGTENIPADMLSKLVPAPVHQHLRQLVSGKTPLITDSTISLPNDMKASSTDNFLWECIGDIFILYGNLLFI